MNVFNHGCMQTQKTVLQRPIFPSHYRHCRRRIALGYFAPAQAPWPVKPLGDGFINLIKMMIAPIIFCTMVSGIAGMGDMKQVGRVGAKAILWFEIITTLALIIGMVLVEILKPGSTLHIDVSQFDTSAVQEKMADAASG